MPVSFSTTCCILCLPELMVVQPARQGTRTNSMRSISLKYALHATPPRHPACLPVLDGQGRAGHSRSAPRICHNSKVRNQYILAKELTKGYAGRSLFSRHWRAQLCTISPAWAQHALRCPPNHLSRMRSYLSLMGP